MSEKFVYRPEDLTFSRELGHGADLSLSHEIANELGRWHFQSPPPENPTLIILGGLQGSGKSTTIEALKRKTELAVISTDAIRYALIHERGIPVSEGMTQTLNMTRNILLRRALRTGRHIVLDQNATRPRIELVEHILREDKEKGYTLKKAYLHASADVLRARVASRRPIPGRYNGSLAELENVLKMYGDPDFSLYDDDKVFNTEVSSPHIIADAIISDLRVSKK